METLSDLDLSVRAFNCLVRYFWRNNQFLDKSPDDIPLVAIAQFTYKDLLGIRSLGKKSAKEIAYKMCLHGYEL